MVSVVTGWVFWASCAALLLTKASDFITTWRHVGQDQESNPLARWLFMRWSFGGGLAVVGVVYVALVGGQYGLVWWLGAPWLLWANAVLGFGIAWVQWDVARTNATGRFSPLTGRLLRWHRRWAEWWSGRR
jgi:hypothetical protein